MGIWDRTRQRIAKAIEPPSKEPKVMGISNRINIRPPAQVTMTEFFKNWSYVCMQQRAQSFAKINQELRDTNGNPIESHWINDLLKRPNKNFTWYGIKKNLQQWLDYSGNAFLWTPKGSKGYPVQMWLFPSNYVKVIPDNTDSPNMISGYEVRMGNVTKTIAPDEICHFKTFAPSASWEENFYKGKADILEAAADAILADKEQVEYIKKYYQKEALPPLAIKSPSTVDEETFSRMRNQMNQSLSSYVPKVLLENGMDIVPLQVSNNNQVGNFDEMLNIKKIAAMFGVPVGHIDTTTQQNRATAQINFERFLSETVEPLVIEFEEQLSIHFQQYDSNIVFGHEKVKYENPEYEVAKYQMYLQNNVLTPNEVRTEIGYEPIEGGDSLLKPPMDVSFPQAIQDATQVESKKKL